MYNQYISQIMELLHKVTFDENGIRIENQDIAFEKLCDRFRSQREKGGHVFFIGNGGSVGVAQHMTADFMKAGRIKTISLFNQANITCLGNDIGYEAVFAKQLEWLAEPGDLLVAVSSSGNSPNIVNGIKAIRSIGGDVITLTGFCEDNVCRSLGDFNVHVPAEHYGMVESIHNLLLQQIVDAMGEES